MKHLVTLVSLVLAAILLCGCLVGCQNSEKENVIFIGATGPLTGDASSYGIAVNRGATIAVEEINANGGINGIQIKYEMKDDKATAEDAQTAYDALMDAGMQISIGSVTSGSCDSFAKKAVVDNVFLMTPSASAANVIADRPNAFRVCFGDPDQGTIAAETLSKEYEKIGCIYDTSDAYSSGIFDAFDAKMKELGKDYIIQKFDAENKKNFSTQVEALKDCDVIFLPIYYTEAGLIAKACVAKGVDALIFGCDGLDGVASQIDDTVTNTIKYITPFDVNSKDEKVVSFVEKYKAAYGEEPTQFAADGYDAMYAVVNAMKAANVNDASISASDLCNLVVKAITDSSFKYDGLTGGMTWDASGACNKEPVIVELGK